MNEEQARKRVEELRQFYSHLGAFIGVNLFLMMVNLLTGPDFFWFLIPLFGWGIGLIAHGFRTYAAGAGWEERKMQELTGLSQTQDELARLSERADALVTILSSVDWEHIDPELLSTRDSLENARAGLRKLREGNAAADRSEVKDEIEKLEEFVTSSKFEYLEKAAHGSTADRPAGDRSN